MLREETGERGGHSVERCIDNAQTEEDEDEVGLDEEEEGVRYRFGRRACTGLGPSVPPDDRNERSIPSRRGDRAITDHTTKRFW